MLITRQVLLTTTPVREASMANEIKAHGCTHVTDEEPTKVCTMCGEIRPLHIFGKSNNGPLGLNYWCKDCKKIRAAIHYKQNKDSIKIRVRDYERRNPDKIAAYILENRSRISSRKKEYCNSHKAEIREYTSKYLSDHAEKIRSSKIAYRENNKGKTQAYSREWYEKNKLPKVIHKRNAKEALLSAGQKKCSNCKEIVPVSMFITNLRRKDRLSSQCKLCRLIAGSRRRAKIRGLGNHHTSHDIIELKKIQRNRCAHPWCGHSIKSGFHIDHIMPIKLGGGNDRRNIQLLCAPCNLRKNAIHPVDYAQRNGMLV